MPRPGYNHRKKFSLTCQKIALEKVYPHLFPPSKYRLLEVDDMPGDLPKTLDIGGVDKVFSGHGSGHLIFLGNRYREASVWNRWREFTIRESEWKRHTKAFENNGILPGFYGYGYANGNRANPEGITDFLKFYVIDYKQWFTDVHNHLSRSPYFKDMQGRQENFYWIKWAAIPRKYFAFVYPPPPIQPGFPQQLPLF